MREQAFRKSLDGLCYAATVAEAALVESIRQALELSGYIVLRLNQRRADKAGGDATWDLAVLHPDCGASSLNMEVKTDTGKLSKRRPVYSDGTYGRSQVDLFTAGHIVVVRSIDQALTEARNWRDRLSITA